MNPPEGQSDPEPEYFDPEEVDMSEQQFSASLDETGESPKFVVDKEAQAGSREDVASAADFQESGEVEEDRTSQHCERQPEPEAQGPDWRDLVSAKVNSYKSRRPQKERYPSLKLPFEPKRWTKPADSVAGFAPVADEAAPLEQAPSPPVYVEPRIVLESTARVIEFPRVSPAPVRMDELAEPVIDRPRIVEAPELLPPPPAMGGILIEPKEEAQPERLPGLDMPLQSAALGKRLQASGIDLALILAAIAVFGYVFMKIAGSMPPWQASAEIAGTLLLVLWPAYQYCFLVFSESTPGLRICKLQLCRFDGSVAPRNLRRWRVLASLLSLLTLGLGYAWCFLDEDELSWHDRITKTHLASAAGSAPGVGRN
jgi:uncharacterized RDD family membrane protein YckC